jgi:hypothetical protein
MRGNNCLYVQHYYRVCVYLSRFGVNPHHRVLLSIFLVLFISSYTQYISEVNDHDQVMCTNQPKMSILQVQICLNNDAIEFCWYARTKFIAAVPILTCTLASRFLQKCKTYLSVTHTLASLVYRHVRVHYTTSPTHQSLLQDTYSASHLNQNVCSEFQKSFATQIYGWKWETRTFFDVSSCDG